MRLSEVQTVLSRFTQDHWIMGFLLLVVLASGGDLLADLSEGVDSAHLIQEAVIMGIAALAVGWIAFSLRQSRVEVSRLKEEMEEIRNMPQPESEAVLLAKRQLAQGIALQFEEWELSKSEQEVGLLLLKGFSLKEVSALRGTAEKTIRHQASAIYKKANVSGRHAFSAWFIEDFL